MNEQDIALINRLNQQPQLRERMEAILNMVENSEGDYTKANDAEQYLIDEMRKMGNEALTCWANKAVKTGINKLHQEISGLQGKGKKKSAGIAPSAK